MEGKTAAIVDIYKLSHMKQSSVLLDTAHYNFIHALNFILLNLILN